MSKKIFILTLMIFVFSLTACQNKSEEELVSTKYINENNGRICSGYALVLENEDLETGGNYVVYKEEQYNQYKKVLDTEEQFFTGHILFTNQQVYFVHEKNEIKVGITSYNLDDSRVKHYRASDMVILNEAYGIKDNFLYVSYTNSNYNASDIYSRLNLENGLFEKISKNDIPDKFDYDVCK